MVNASSYCSPRTKRGAGQQVHPLSATAGTRSTPPKRTKGRRLDPEGAESRMLHRMVDFSGKDVLEIGCGDGRMTFRYAGLATSVLGIDPDESKISLALERTPTSLRSTVSFQALDVAAFDAPAGTFDLVILSWFI